ncbi:hypothetical protein VPNG_00536 [Cytospora leucostoma]|uniref:Uncharacterized protein n=1 Tax=Cytospora leucostoma TaxID=1230097 RepID=A0A423XML0_9PEZI|nr:hypothetical protein VPNG_00536 [Cytospora leucostoma]
MNVTATPTKRRVLGSLDVNVQMSPRLSKVTGSPLKKGNSHEAMARSSRNATPSPRKQPVSKEETPKKRALEEGEGEARVGQPVQKKLCSDSMTATEVSNPTTVENGQAAAVGPDEDVALASQATAGRRSISPDASSVFDASVMNTSQDTTITEPDTDAPVTITTTTTTTTAAQIPIPFVTTDTLTSLPPPPPPARRIPTREEFRKKAEILRLRLSLATYKVQTGQADVPLEELQVRPVPGMTRRRTPLPSMSAHTIQRSTPAQQWYRSRAPAGRYSAAAAAVPAAAAEEGQALGEGGVGESDGNDDDDNDNDDDDDDKKAADDNNNSSTSSRPSPPVKSVLPGLPPPSVVSTPRKRGNQEEEEARLSSSALRGGAAKGLLSLSQGSL